MIEHEVKSILCGIWSWDWKRARPKASTFEKPHHYHYCCGQNVTKRDIAYSGLWPTDREDQSTIKVLDLVDDGVDF
ncbi:hypothetical protein WN944_013680 [Citrus x changshan-huyou]|uniref:Uncharacterized protein n=1 Tax=Citrus x changshan-huyou TaxID=2935761 RepID=A0AAP0MAQ6_9ROSI